MRLSDLPGEGVVALRRPRLEPSGARPGVVGRPFYLSCLIVSHQVGSSAEHSVLVTGNLKLKPNLPHELFASRQGATAED